jgi:pyruvate dehydrogenase E1 component alpha subunit
VLLNEGLITEDQVEEIDREAKEETNSAVQYAEESPFPDESDILTDVYWEVDHGTDAAKYGRYFFNP